jgi:hypothetical protein
MAIGVKAKDIFARTDKPDVSPGSKPASAAKGKGRPAVEAYDKVTVCLFKRHVLLLDRVALGIREKLGKNVSRAEIIRALVDQATDDLDPGKAGFEAKARGLLQKV